MKQKKTKKTTGRPPIFKTAEELQEKIKEYFEKSPDTKQILVGPKDNRELIDVPVYTISGLVLFCGFADRKAFYDYEKKKEFSYTIKRARELIAKQYEMMIAVGEGHPAGAIFALKNFGWSDKLEIEHGLADSYFEKYAEMTDTDLEDKFNALCGRN